MCGDECIGHRPPEIVLGAPARCTVSGARDGMGLALRSGVPARVDRQRLGRLGEDLACRELRRRGYAILARRYRTRFGEIDIVSEQSGVVVFVEVKARRTGRFGTAAESIPGWKRRRLAAMALDYLAWTERLGCRCRFDVVAIDGIGTDRTTSRVVENAFAFDR
jgi:putative endonuclease